MGFMFAFRAGNYSIKPLPTHGASQYGNLGFWEKPTATNQSQTTAKWTFGIGGGAFK